MERKFFIARDKDKRLFKFPCWNDMFATEAPHRRVNGYPFDGNYYSEDTQYRLSKGEEIDRTLYPNITYENSPVLFVRSDMEESIAREIQAIFPIVWTYKELTPLGKSLEYEMISLARHCPLQ